MKRLLISMHCDSQEGLRVSITVPLQIIGSEYAVHLPGSICQSIQAITSVLLRVMSLFICPNQPSLQLRIQVTNNKFIINKQPPPPLLNRIVYEPCNYRGGQDAQIQDTSLVLWPIFIMSNTQVQSENMLYRATLPCRAWALHIHSKSLQFFYTRTIILFSG